MKVIDLLNKIANGEEVPKKIKVGSDLWNYDDEIDYKAEDDRGYLFEVHTRLNEEDLNEEVEIIEEDKKIEKLVFNKDQDGDILVNGVSLIEKVNEIIDKLNKEE